LKVNSLPFKVRFIFRRDEFGGDILLFKPSDFELKAIYSVEITATREDLGLVAKKTITVTVIDLDDEAHSQKKYQPW
jgi:hypothetical protein